MEQFEPDANMLRATGTSTTWELLDGDVSEELGQ
jgi:hypothetical protein